MRRPLKKKLVPRADAKYSSVRVSKLINYIMLDGKKDTARNIVYKAFDLMTVDGGDALSMYEEALKNVEPQVEVRSRRVGGANYQVPREVRPERRLALALRWIIDAARSKKGVPMHIKLSEELKAAAKGTGEAVAKRDSTHRMAEANKAFAHFAW
jgi:small subunit ribosomal protein S7